MAVILKVAKERTPTPESPAPRLTMLHHGLTVDEVSAFLDVGADDAVADFPFAIGGKKVGIDTEGGHSSRDTTHIINPISTLSVTATRTSRNRHKIEIESPPIYGRRFYWRESIDEELLGQRIRYISEVLNLAKDSVVDSWLGSIRQGTIISIEEAELWELWTVMDAAALTPRENEAKVHIRSDIFKDVDMPGWVNDSGGWFTKTVWEELQHMQSKDRPGGALDAWLVVAAIHETWLEFQSAIEEGIDMAKGKDEMLWWTIEGDPNKLTAFCVSLNRSSHMLVYDTARRVYLQGQTSEQQFVKSHARKHNL